MMVIDKVSRNFFLFLSHNRLISSGAKKWGLKFGASQVVAGVKIDEMLQALKKLNSQGLVCTVDHLGEYVKTKEEAEESTEMACQTLEAISQSGVSSHMSVKLTQLGLDIDEQFCLDNMKKIVRTAKKHQIFIRIDMEDYSRCQKTLNILAELRKDYEDIGTVIQAYLHRAEKDVDEMSQFSLRLVKGAYKESAKVAYQDKEKVDENYLTIIKKHLVQGKYTAIATHDHHIIDQVKQFAADNNIPISRFEFQMLYGMRTELQKSIADEGYTMRVYVPFGKDWYGYFMRRLAERPQNVMFAVRGLFSKK
ncbi:proline dehydrogenase family protein [Alkalihalobacillus pseudalcaliphilus]|uniref:proline dehydrogenase family protein n=1 Tax=Alkalihalobacillus pseudalcaliphilus TaxID=79884 RepID=UPI00064DDCAD|nr:proline dehydrogenase [Alkalihalobacillus pseudalcaliphilus]KMK74413.1 proline dehydrogenase [Alkalihalobacillus pseudalcaliphilus]